MTDLELIRTTKSKKCYFVKMPLEHTDEIKTPLAVNRSCVHEEHIYYLSQYTIILHRMLDDEQHIIDHW